MPDPMPRLKAALDCLHRIGWHGDAEALAWAISEIERLRAIMTRFHLDPDQCSEFPGGEQCALRHGHEGKHVWGRGD